MAKARKSKRPAKKAKRKTKAKAKTRAKSRKTRARRRTKPPAGALESVVSAVEETAALRERLAGRNTFED